MKKKVVIINPSAPSSSHRSRTKNRTRKKRRSVSRKVPMARRTKTRSTRKRSHRRTRRHRAHRRVRRNASKSLLFHMAKAAARRPRKKAKRTRRRARLSRFFSAKEHRPRVRIIRGRKLEIFRPRSPYKGVITRANPRKGYSMKRRRTRRNPSAALSRVGINKAWIVNAAAMGFGFVAAAKGTKYLYNIPGVEKFNRFVGVLHILIGGFVAVKVKKPLIRSAAAGFAAAGAFDLIAKNIPIGVPTLLGLDHDVVMGLDHAAMGTDYDGENAEESLVGAAYDGDEDMGSDY